MSPEEFAKKHPTLYHLTNPAAVDGIMKQGLLPTTALLSLYKVSKKERAAIQGKIRPASVTISHPELGSAQITDNIPMSEKALMGCLDDGLTTSDWMDLLNSRVFFWPNEASALTHLAASTRRGNERSVMILDTLSLAQALHNKIEITAINSGSTIRKPARRGNSTFSPIDQYEYKKWQALRGGRDTVKEVTVVGGVPAVKQHLIECVSSAVFLERAT
jgi:hypothetical protein